LVSNGKRVLLLAVINKVFHSGKLCGNVIYLKRVKKQAKLKRQLFILQIYSIHPKRDNVGILFPHSRIALLWLEF
jgi:hypothetical protein